LLREGIPLVLAMQTRVTDSYATKLAGWFYAELATRHEPLASQALAQARRALETERAKAHAAGAKGEHAIPEYATASLFLGGEETPILDYALDRIPLRTPPVHAIDGPVPQLRMDDLIGRRRVAASDTPRIARASEGRPSPTAPTTSAISQCRSFESRPRAT
jgi:hypothetical protein